MTNTNRPDLAYAADTLFGMGNCGVVALSVATGHPYRQVHEWIRQNGNKPANWKGGTFWREREAYLNSHEIRFEYEELPGKITLNQWVRRYSRPGVTYIVTTTCHVQIVRDGHVIDQNTRGVVHISAYPLRRKFLQRRLGKHAIIRVDPEAAPRMVNAAKPTPRPVNATKPSSPAKGKNLGVTARIRHMILFYELTALTKAQAEFIATNIRREFPESRAGVKEVRWTLWDMKRKGIIPA